MSEKKHKKNPDSSPRVLILICTFLVLSCERVAKDFLRCSEMQIRVFQRLLVANVAVAS